VTDLDEMVAPDGKRIIRMSWHDPEFGALLTQSELISRGWTKTRIRKELGEPDCYGLNPRGGYYVLLYSEDRTRRPRLRIVRSNPLQTA
jgi:hypothetical protein